METTKCIAHMNNQENFTNDFEFPSKGKTLVLPTLVLALKFMNPPIPNETNKEINSKWTPRYQTISPSCISSQDNSTTLIFPLSQSTKSWILRWFTIAPTEEHIQAFKCPINGVLKKINGEDRIINKLIQEERISTK